MADYAADISINDYLFREEIIVTETGGEDRTSFPVKNYHLPPLILISRWQKVTATI